MKTFKHFGEDCSSFFRLFCRKKERQKEVKEKKKKKWKGNETVKE
jgi:hypothetical protein